MRTALAFCPRFFLASRTVAWPQLILGATVNGETVAMSKELDDVTRALAELLTVVGRSTESASAEQAIVQVVDSLVMALGGIERLLNFPGARPLSETPLSEGADALNGRCAN